MSILELRGSFAPHRERVTPNLCFFSPVDALFFEEQCTPLSEGFETKGNLFFPALLYGEHKAEC